MRTRSGAPATALVGLMETIDGLSKQSPQERQPRPKTIVRANEKLGIALRTKDIADLRLPNRFPRTEENLRSWQVLLRSEPRLEVVKPEEQPDDEATVTPPDW